MSSNWYLKQQMEKIYLVFQFSIYKGTLEQYFIF